jgi:hypothetical protein
MSRFYGFDRFQPGDTVRIADAETLAGFARTWKLHHPLEPDQLPFAGKTAMVTDSSMYFGGDILYTLEGVPGVWHQRLLSVP